MTQLCCQLCLKCRLPCTSVMHGCAGPCILSRNTVKHAYRGEHPFGRGNCRRFLSTLCFMQPGQQVFSLQPLLSVWHSCCRNQFWLISTFSFQGLLLLRLVEYYNCLFQNFFFNMCVCLQLYQRMFTCLCVDMHNAVMLLVKSDRECTDYWVMTDFHGS